MSTTSQALGAHAAPRVIEHDGKRYEARLITQGLKSAFERWMEDRALAAAGRIGAAMPPEERAEATREAEERVVGGHYRFGGEAFARVVKTPAGSLKLASLVFGCTEGEMAALLAERQGDVESVLRVVARESAPKPRESAGGEGDDPNG